MVIYAVLMFFDSFPVMNTYTVWEKEGKPWLEILLSGWRIIWVTNDRPWYSLKEMATRLLPLLLLLKPRLFGALRWSSSSCSSWWVGGSARQPRPLCPAPTPSRCWRWQLQTYCRQVAPLSGGERTLRTREMLFHCKNLISPEYGSWKQLA